ncbi:hypothetical protein EDD21DRAFT_438449 [Dissophora ornata]|nr:hypothetical protein EDD21DRAFT_438449 [Dissophora ornata]
MIQYSQAFRAHLSHNIICIPTQFDNKTNQHVVCWDDIKQCFENAKYVLNRGEVVPFIKGNNLKYLTPLRISYHAGVVLEVVTDTKGSQSVSTADLKQQHITVVSSTTNSHPELSTPPSCVDTGKIQSLPHQLSNLSIIADPVDVGATSNSLVTPFAQSYSRENASFQSYKDLFTSDFEVLKAGQVHQATGIKDAMDVHVQHLQVEMNKNKTLQEQVILMQQQMDAKQDQVLLMQQQIDAKQDQMLQLQNQAVVILSTIQNKIQSVLTQTFELHEYPIPRLFIVLPKAKRIRDTLGKPFSNEFRLFFLCECGAHTMVEGSRIQHEVHLAKHGGYDISRPKEFFRKYGSYVLTMMQMIKYGVRVAGIIVPPLAHFRVGEGIEAVQKTLKLAGHSIGVLVDHTIAYLQDQKNGTGCGIDVSTGQDDFDRMEVLEGAELRQLQSYLNASDKDQLLGNLYRMVTDEGHVKWVCNDHFRENYRYSSIQKLKELVAANGGSHNEVTGGIRISLTSKSRAKRFYEAIVKARGIQELDITFEWDATLKDLRIFESVISTTNIIKLTINGYYFKGPALDFINRHRRFVPILELMNNRRIQSLSLNGFKHFDQHISRSFTSMAPQLRSLSFGQGFTLKDIAGPVIFLKMLQQCPSLNELKLSSRDQYPLFEATLNKMSDLPRLQYVSLYSEQYSFWTNASNGKVKKVQTEIHQLEDLSAIDKKAFQNGYITCLTMKQTPRESDEALIVDIICHNPKLSQANIPSHGERSNDIVKLVTSTTERIEQEGNTTALEILQLADSEGYNVRNKKPMTSISGSWTMAGDPIFDLDTDIEIDDDNPIDEKDIPGVFRQYGWLIETLFTLHNFSDSLAALFEEATRSTIPRLKRLFFNPWSLTPSGLDCMDQVIERAEDLDYFLLDLHELEDKSQRDKADQLLRRYANRLQVLVMDGNASNQWIVHIKALIPERLSLPELTCFEISDFDKPYLSRADVQWLAAIVAPPPTPCPPCLFPLHTPPTPSSAAFLDVSDTWTPLTTFVLGNFQLWPEDWKTLIEAIDFTTLEELDFEGANFLFEQLQVLVNHVSNFTEPEIPLKKLDLRSVNPCHHQIGLFVQHYYNNPCPLGRQSDIGGSELFGMNRS